MYGPYGVLYNNEFFSVEPSATELQPGRYAETWEHGWPSQTEETQRQISFIDRARAHLFWQGYEIRVDGS